MNIEFSLAMRSDFDELTRLQGLTFNEHIIYEEFLLLISNDYGEIFLAKIEGRIVGFQAVLYKPFNNSENVLQPILKEKRFSGENVFHDDVDFDESKYYYLHLLAVHPSVQGRGISQILLKYVDSIVKSRYPTKRAKACIRINNLRSIRVCMSTLDIYMDSLKPINKNIIGSRETNFIAISSERVKPVKDPRKLPLYTEISNCNEIDGSPIIFESFVGFEKDLLSDPQQKKMKSLIIYAYKKGYKVLGLFKGTEIGKKGGSYFYLERI